ncbi:MAG TPA: hypothetical protein DCO89_00720 [Clostridiales bacterium]|nr:hypothetical protein [Clostridiales bacterium]
MKNVNSEKLLNALGKNVSMAVQSLELILPEVTDEKFKEYLSKLNDEYSIVLTEAQMLAKANDMELKLTTPIEKAKLWTSIKLEMLMNKSTRKFATMIFLGTNMGIPDLVIAISDFGDASKEVLELAHKLKQIEEESDEKLKYFISFKEK